MSTDPDAGDKSPLSETGLASDPAVLDSLVASPTVALVTVGPDDTVQWLDETAASYFGLADREGVGEDRTRFYESSVQPCLEHPDRFPGEETAPRDTDAVHVLSEGRRDERWLRYHSTPIAAGQFAGGRLEQFVDVTAEHDRARFEQYRHIVETTDDAVFVLDSDLAVEYANPAAQAQTDSPLSAITGRPMLSVVEGLVAADAEFERFERALETVFDEDSDGSTAVELQLAVSSGRETHSLECKPADDRAVVTVRNVSEQRQRERRYETLVDNFPNGAVTLVDDTLQYQLAGGKLFDSLDETPGEVEGSDIGELSAGNRDVFIESYRDALNGTSVTVETTVGDRDLVLRTLPVYDDDGAVRVAIGMTQDITERKQRAEELRWKSRALDEAPVGVAITDPQQTENPVIYANEQFSELSGYDTDAILGRNCRFLQGPETDPATVDRLRDAIDAERPVSVELRNYRSDGSQFWNHLEIAPVHDETGALVNYVGFQQDVTARKEQERELREANQLLDIALTETDTGIWILEHYDDAVVSFGTTTELFGLDPGTHELDTYLDRIHPEDRPVVEEALRTARERDERFDTEFRVLTGDRERWIQARGTVSEDDAGTHPRIVGVAADITDSKRRVHALEKRECVLNELHTATREFYPPESLTEIAEFLVEFTDNAFDVEYASVKQYDEETGTLEPAVRSVSTPDADRGVGTVTPGSNPIWDSYRTGETRLFADEEIDGILDGIDAEISQLLVAPVGDFGVLVVAISVDSGFEDVDVDLVEVLTANAESAFQRLRSDRVHTAIAKELSTQQSRVAELNGIIDAVQAVQRRLADSDSQSALEGGVCEELLAMDRVDFVWLGHPSGEDTDLSPAAWAGDADGYLDSVLTDGPESLLPAERAANDHSVYRVPDIAGRVLDESWAKDALSYDFASVSSIPLLYDDVLYGVLTVYSRTENAFDGIYDDLFGDVASLMVNYSRILDQRQVGTGRMHTELEFGLTDSNYPLQRLAAATDSTIRLDTVAERTADHIRLLVTVVDGDAAAVLDRASSMTGIDAAGWFGDTEHSQLSLLVRKPFLESLVSKHGGRLLGSVSDEAGTSFRLEIPATLSQRPIFDSLTSRYEEIDLVAKRQQHSQAVPDTRRIEDLLTDRQYEIINAAFHGGYYETPRRVQGEDLAESFDISGPAVYNHLQAAHRTLLEAVFDSEPKITSENDGLDG